MNFRLEMYTLLLQLPQVQYVSVLGLQFISYINVVFLYGYILITWTS